MKLLCVDTSKKEALVALILDGEDYVLKIPDTMKHSESLMNYIEKALTDKGIDIADLDAVGAITGPGSFTGIRVGMSVIKAISYAGKKDILSSDMFDVVKDRVGSGYFILNSTMTTIYYGKLKNKKLVNTGYIKKDDFYKIVEEDKVYAMSSEQSSVSASYKDIEYIDDIDTMILDIFKKKYDKKDFTLDSNFTPMYIQLSQAEENLKAKKDE